MSVEGVGVAEVLEVMDAMEWGFNYRRCPICAGFDPKGNGETDRQHTKTCPFPDARAFVAALKTTEERK